MRSGREFKSARRYLWGGFLRYEVRALLTIAGASAFVTVAAVILFGLQASADHARTQTSVGLNAGYQYAVSAPPGTPEYTRLMHSEIPRLSPTSTLLEHGGRSVGATGQIASRAEVADSYGFTLTSEARCTRGVSISRALAERLRVKAGDRLMLETTAKSGVGRSGVERCVQRVFVLPSTPHVLVASWADPSHRTGPTRWLARDVDAHPPRPLDSLLDSDIRVTSAHGLAEALKATQAGESPLLVYVAPLGWALTALSLVGLAALALPRWDRHRKGLLAAHADPVAVDQLFARGLTLAFGSGVMLGACLGTAAIMLGYRLFDASVDHFWIDGSMPWLVVVGYLAVSLGIGTVAIQWLVHRKKRPTMTAGEPRRWPALALTGTGIALMAVGVSTYDTSPGVGPVFVGSVLLVAGQISFWTGRSIGPRPTALSAVTRHLGRMGRAVAVAIALVTCVTTQIALFALGDARAVTRANAPEMPVGSVTLDHVQPRILDSLSEVVRSTTGSGDPRVFERVDQSSGFWLSMQPSDAACVASLRDSSLNAMMGSECIVGSDETRAPSNTVVLSPEVDPGPGVRADPRLMERGEIGLVRVVGEKVTMVTAVPAIPDSALGNVMPGAAVNADTLPGPTLKPSGELVAYFQPGRSIVDAGSLSAGVAVVDPTTSVFVGEPVDVAIETGAGRLMAIAGLTGAFLLGALAVAATMRASEVVLGVLAHAGGRRWWRAAVGARFLVHLTVAMLTGWVIGAASGMILSTQPALLVGVAALPLLGGLTAVGLGAWWASSPSRAADRVISR